MNIVYHGLDFLPIGGFRGGKIPIGITKEQIDGAIEKATKQFIDNLGLPKQCIFNEQKNTTVLIWKDGEKTKVKKSKDEKFDKRIAFLTAYFQRHSGLSKTKANEYLKNL